MHPGRNPFLTTFLTTIVMTLVSLVVATTALRAAGIPFVATLLGLTIALPVILTPIVVYPLLAMIRRQWELSAKLERQALTDGLTELPNRRAFSNSRERSPKRSRWTEHLWWR